MQALFRQQQVHNHTVFPTWSKMDDTVSSLPASAFFVIVASVLRIETSFGDDCDVPPLIFFYHRRPFKLALGHKGRRKLERLVVDQRLAQELGVGPPRSEYFEAMLHRPFTDCPWMRFSSFHRALR
jgi:hypothetical protein